MSLCYFYNTTVLLQNVSHAENKAPHIGGRPLCPPHASNGTAAGKLFEVRRASRSATDARTQGLPCSGSLPPASAESGEPHPEPRAPARASCAARLPARQCWKRAWQLEGAWQDSRKLELHPILFIKKSHADNFNFNRAKYRNTRGTN
jgi:hypothetical protein